MGYIRRIDEKQYEFSRKSGDFFYSKNDFIGITGLESQYEKHLRGKRGSINYLKDFAGNKIETIDKTPYGVARHIRSSLHTTRRYHL